MDIFCGKRSDRLPHVVSSGEQDNVLVFWSGHGMQGNLSWGDVDNFSHRQAAELFDTLHRRRKYRKMLWFVETCYAGSVAKACEGIPGIMCMTASGEWETSKPDIPYKSVWLSNRFTYSLLSEPPDRKYPCGNFTTACSALLSDRTYKYIMRGTMVPCTVTT